MSRPMRVLVFGAGAIGCFLGHRLAQSGHEVTLLGRPALVATVRQHGLTLSSKDSGTSVVWPRAVESAAEIPSAERNWDLILLTVKVYDTEEASRMLAPHLPDGTPVLLVQNGVGGEELAAQSLPAARLISGVLTMSVSMEQPGRLRQETSSGGLNIASVQAERSAATLEAVLGQTALRVAPYNDYRAMKWSKLLLNLLANAVPAILDMSPGEVYRDPAIFALEREAFLEAVQVMRGLGHHAVNFPGYPVRLLVWAMLYLPMPVLRPSMTRLVASGRGDKRPSLQLDLNRGRKQSEVFYLNGAVVEQGERLHIDTPVNCAIVKTFVGLMDGQLSWDEYRHRPAKLLGSIRG